MKTIKRDVIPVLYFPEYKNTSETVMHIPSNCFTVDCISTA